MTDDAELKATVQYSNFNNSAAGLHAVYLGNQDLSDYVYTHSVSWSRNSSNNPISFSYKAAQTKTTAKSSTLSYDSGELGKLNYLEFDLYKSANAHIVQLIEIKIEVMDANDNVINTYNFTDILSATCGFNIIKIDLGNNFRVSAKINLSQPQNNDNSIRISVGYYVPDEEAPKVRDLLATPSRQLLGEDVLITATIDDSETGDSKIKSADYSLDGEDWYPMEPSDGRFDSSIEDVKITIPTKLLDCGGPYKIYVRGTDVKDNTSSGGDYTYFYLYELGSISGTVYVNDAGVGGVIIKLEDPEGNFLEMADLQEWSSTSDGGYAFEFLLPSENFDLEPNTYLLSIVLPLGFTVEATGDVGDLTDLDKWEITVPDCDNDLVVDFTLTQIPVTNVARSKGYWKHQFDMWHHEKPGFIHESMDQLLSYINRLRTNYITHYTWEDVFNTSSEDMANFGYWFNVLGYGGPDMRQKALSHFAALLLNYASLKIHQLEVVTKDGRNVADAITEISEILANEKTDSFKRAKDIAEYINIHLMIPAGWVQDWNMLYKKGIFGPVTEYALSANYPNPFNPSTVINFAIPQSGFVTLKVYDVLGKEVATLVNEVKSEGYHSVAFDAGSLTSGVYIYQIQAGSFTTSKKMILMK